MNKKGYIATVFYDDGEEEMFKMFFSDLKSLATLQIIHAGIITDKDLIIDSVKEIKYEEV